MEEIWVDINGYGGKYKISSKGHVMSMNYNNTGKPKELKLKINRYGYNEVKLSKNNKTKNYLIITLVAEHFLVKPADDMIPIHIGDISDDSVENIEYGYRSEMLHLTYKKGRRKIGKPSGNIVSYKGKAYRKWSELARDYKISPELMFKRLNRGWNLSEALEIPSNLNKHLKVKLYKYNGKLYTVKQLSEISGISEKNIYERLKRGWDIESAVEIPLGRKVKYETNI